MLTNKAKYGLKALMYMAKNIDKGQILIADISKNENIPLKFLEAILVELKRKGYIQSKRGKGGGYWLIKKPKDIIIGDVIRIFDGPLAPVRCASYTAYIPCSDCDDVSTCKIRFLMKEVREKRGLAYSIYT